MCQCSHDAAKFDDSKKDAFGKSGFHLQEGGAAFDPICGMEVDPAQSKFSSDFKSRTYYFCSEGCKDHFDSDPEMYLG